MAPMTGKVNPDWKVDLDSADFSNKSILVVGGTSGLGQAIALEAVSRGCSKVTVVGRSFKDEPEKIHFVQADLSSLKEAQRIGETVEPADVVVFTTGILAPDTRTTTGDDIEMDLAVSYLSRLVILTFLAPRLKEKSRVFIMGFPGSNQKNYKVDDLNAEESYEGGVGFVHVNTVVGNEALVLAFAAKSTGAVTYFGLNPGLIKTGIREALYTGWKKYLGIVVEALIGLFSTSAEGYAKTITPLLFSSGLEEHNGSMFNPSAQPTFKSEFMDDDLVNKFMENSKTLVESKTGIKL